MFEAVFFIFFVFNLAERPYLWDYGLLESQISFSRL